ncbi:MAG: chemotaxis protein CheW [Myxococcota bacterium]|nr:purine-binding chemotaxis protein CheW [Myxococcales bacterium]
MTAIEPSVGGAYGRVDPPDDVALREQFLTFEIAGETYGVALSSVDEIIGFQRMTVVPDAAGAVVGVINLRGTVVPVVDVRRRFGMEAREVDERTCIIVVHVRDESIGLLVDTVSEVVDAPAAAIEKAPRSAADPSATSMIRGLVRVEDDVKILLDVERLLFDDVDGEAPGEHEEKRA